MIIEVVKDFLLENRELFTLIMSLSLISLIISILVIPILIIKMPSDYFLIEHSEYIKRRVKHPIARFLIHFLKNSLGCLFLAAGVVLLFIPGQGVLTMLIGLSMLDFSFKRKIEYKIVSRPVVLRLINGIRGRAGKNNLEV